MIRLIASLVLVAALAACGDLPRPFEHGGVASNPLLEKPDGRALAVEVEGMDRAALIAALQAEGVPATALVPDAAPHHRLTGHVATAEDGALVAHWTLRDEGGASMAQAATEGEAMALPVLLAGDVAALLLDPVEVPSPSALRLVAVEGAGEQADRLIGTAFAALLARAGDRLAAPDEPALAEVVCSVALGPPEDGRRMVAVTWSVSRPGGAPLGTVRQANAVPLGTGIGEDVAFAIAAGGLDGVFDMLRAAGLR